MVWQFNDHRAAPAQQLAEVGSYQPDVLILAEPNGVRQAVIAGLAGASRTHVSQIVSETAIPGESTDELLRLWGHDPAHGPAHDLEWFREQLKKFANINTDAEREKWNARFALVHGGPETSGWALPDQSPEVQRGRRARNLGWSVTIGAAVCRG